MNWYKRSVVERVKALLDGHYIPDQSSSLLILPQTDGVIDPEKQLYWDITLKTFPNSQGNSFGASDVRGGIVIALKEAISEMSLPDFVWVETIDDTSWRFGRLHGMRRIGYEKSVADRCMDAFLKIVGHIINVGIEGFIILHFLVTGSVLVIAAMAQNDTLTAITTVALSLTILKDNDWRSLQKQRLAGLAHRKEEWRESELDYRKRLRERCTDPVRWNLTKIYVYSRISKLLLGNLVDRYYKWNASRRPGIRLAMMSNGNVSPSP